MLERKTKWHEQYSEGELNQILLLLGELDALKFFDAVAIELENGLISQITGLQDTVALDNIKAFKAKISLLSRIKSEATDLVRQYSPESQGERE